MKMKGAKQVHYDSGPNMTPLVDVVMVILIFLMLAGSFGSSTHYLMSKQVIRSKGTGGAKVDPNSTDIDLRVDPKDSVVDNVMTQTGFVAHLGSFATSSPDALVKALTEKHDQLVAAGKPDSGLQVIIDPNGSLLHEYVIQVYNSAMRAKFEKIALTSGH